MINLDQSSDKRLVTMCEIMLILLKTKKITTIKLYKNYAN